MKIYDFFHWASGIATRCERYELFRKGIKRQLKILPSPSHVIDREQKQKINSFFKETIGIKPTLYWHQFYSSINGNNAHEYIPTDMYYAIIQPRLFDMTVCAAYDDKNLYDTLFPDALLPETIVKCSNGHYYNAQNILISRKEAEQICRNLQEAILKPAYQSAGGAGVIKINVENGHVNKGKSIQELFDAYESNFIIQKTVKQHDSLKKLNPTSVNTLGILTYFREDDVVVLYSVMKIGAKGAVIDNAYKGGKICKINDGGTLDKYAYDFKQASRTETGNDGLVFEGYTIPCYSQVIEKAKQYHKRLPHIPLIRWDFTVDDQNRVVLIEFNAPSGIEEHQMAVGPAWGKYTAEILSKCKSKKRTV